MPRSCSILLAALFAVSTFTSVRAQTSGISIPVWIEADHCETGPKFAVTLNGKPAPITAQWGPNSDQIILLVLDLTSSLSLIDPAKQALVSQTSKLPRNTWVGLLRAQDGLHVLTDPGVNRKPAISAIQSLSNSGEPGLLETVTSALSLADAILRKTPVRVSVLYVTDGSIYSYREDYTNPVINPSDPHDLSRRFPEALIEDKISRLVKTASSLQAPLFVVQLNYRPDPLNEAYQNGLETLARATGGESDICQSLAQIPDVISEMFARISGTWRLNLALPARVRHDIQIHLRAPCRKGDPRISWRKHFLLNES
ncbi:MAG TPA: hypothetical protein VMX16_12875 [Terriglobia bacterium]|nr:hypothetical protein [Terriglobia bacterium]